MTKTKGDIWSVLKRTFSAGPHGGGYLLWLMVPFAVLASLGAVYLVAFTVLGFFAYMAGWPWT